MFDDSSDDAIPSMSSPFVDHTSGRQLPRISVDLIQAQPEHLKIGRTIYVRGERACIVEMDYPNIFWCLDNCENIKHRNFDVDREMFQVVQGTENPTDDNTYSPIPKNLFQMPNEVSEILGSDQNEDTYDAEDPTNLAVAGVMSMLSIRAADEYTDEIDANIECQLHNSRMHLLNCAQSKFKFPNKQASIFVQSCVDCDIQYHSIISSVEILKCYSTKLTSTGECGSIIIESCRDIVVTFPANSSIVLIVCTSCTNVILRAISNGAVAAETNVNIQDESAVPAEGEGSGESDPSVPLPLEHPQMRTLWNGVAFDTQRIIRENADGSGHIRNLNRF
uniref:C-CAP/cofactor C-like domain-containing protein n=1 Tax=Spongospora subterranea TaxID=70186 RepID=A0A0H5R5F5_9EUKA|eukprot:CRZ09395.1 hypothetical protein [Spongospora subterranea]